MNILILSGSSPFFSSGIAVYDMYKSLSDSGNKVVLLTRYYDERFDNNMFSIYNKLGSTIDIMYNKIRYKFSFTRETNRRFYMHSVKYKENYINTKIITNRIDKKIDLILYVFPHRFLTDQNIYELSQHYKCPVLIMPADLAQITGGCHYSNECDGYTVLCGNCPGLFSKDEIDLSRKTMLYKTDYVQKTDSVILGNNWQMDYINKSSLYADKKKYNVNIVINENTFSPGNVNKIRTNYNIPIECKLIFFGATYLDDERKGLKYLIESLQFLSETMTEIEKQKTALLIAGGIDEELLKKLPLKAYQLGRLNYQQLADAYRMADVYVSSSIMDAGPMMVAQAMMCGTPVIAFEMGNAKDYIINGKTGIICKLADSKSLMQGIQSFLNMGSDEINNMRNNCRNHALHLSSYNSFATRMNEIFKSLKN